ncbi:MAG: enoyl-CoA hydratase [Erythrobacter sp.]
MFGNNFGIRFASAACSVIISAAFLAYAIIPASPSLMA